MAEKAIIVAELAHGTVAQWWDLEAKVVGITRPQCVAHVDPSGGSAVHALVIDHLCPPEWAAEAWAAYRGDLPEPTHTVRWERFKAPVFTPIERPACQHADTVFSREVCACGSMHYHCQGCGKQTDPCPDDPVDWDGHPNTPVTEEVLEALIAEDYSGGKWARR